jgi:hypothetical protein
VWELARNAVRQYLQTRRFEREQRARAMAAAATDDSAPVESNGGETVPRQREWSPRFPAVARRQASAP